MNAPLDKKVLEALRKLPPEDLAEALGEKTTKAIVANEATKAKAKETALAVALHKEFTATCKARGISLGKVFQVEGKLAIYRNPDTTEEYQYTGGKGKKLPAWMADEKGKKRKDAKNFILPEGNRDCTWDDEKECWVLPEVS